MKKFNPSEKNYSVYVHLFPNEKLYIGATRQNPIYRWRRGGGYRNCKVMNDAINEFGWDNIQHIILMDGLDQATAMIVEQVLIEKYKTRDQKYGYNTKNGGQHFDAHSEEFMSALRDRMTGNTYSVGRKMSESHREALSKANKGHHRPSTFKGKHHTEETKKLFSEMRKKRWEDPDYRSRVLANRPDMSGKNNPRYGKPVSEETRKKISQANKGICRPSREHLETLWKKCSKPVACLNLNGDVVAHYPSLASAARAVGAHSANIGFCCRNHDRTCKGFMWRYEDAQNADRS